jgi:hypothetical protein
MSNEPPEKKPKKKPRGDYTVGYAKPPEHGRFEKGQSGNIAGRPKRPQSFKSLLKADLKKKIVVNEGGRRKRIEKLEGIARVMVNAGLSGNHRVSREIIRLLGTEAEVDDTQLVEEEEARRLKALAAQGDVLRKLAGGLTDDQITQLINAAGIMMYVRAWQNDLDLALPDSLFSDALKQSAHRVWRYIKETYG